VVQDDTGIPVRFFLKGGWQLFPFGEYVGPIPVFRGHYQPKLDELFERVDAPPISFGVGYRWRPNQSHVLLAVSKEPRTAPAGPPAAAPAKATAPKGGTAPKRRIGPARAPPKAPNGASGSPPGPAPPGTGSAATKPPAPLPQNAGAVPDAWRALLLGGPVSVALAGVFGPGGFAAGLSFVLQLGGIGGVVWLLASDAAGQEQAAARPS
jgi:hypothetical protein